MLDGVLSSGKLSLMDQITVNGHTKLKGVKTVPHSLQSNLLQV
jgi:hypothetical protein